MLKCISVQNEIIFVYLKYPKLIIYSINSVCGALCSHAKSLYYHYSHHHHLYIYEFW